MTFASPSQGERTHPNLVLDLCREPLVGYQPDVLGLVLVRHGDVPPIRNEVDDLGHSKVIALDGERQVEDTVDVVLEHPYERLVVLGVDRLEVVVVDGLAEHVLVDGAREVRFEDALVMECFPDDATDELEEGEMVWVDGGRLDIYMTVSWSA